MHCCAYENVNKNTFDGGAISVPFLFCNQRQYTRIGRHGAVVCSMVSEFIKKSQHIRIHRGFRQYFPGAIDSQKSNQCEINLLTVAYGSTGVKRNENPAGFNIIFDNNENRLLRSQ